MERDDAARDRRWGRGPRDRIDLLQERLDAVRDVDLVAGRARSDERQLRTVDRDGVARDKTRRQRVRTGRQSRQRRRPADVPLRRPHHLVLLDRSRERTVGVEEIVARFDRRCRDQRGIGQRADRGVQRGVQVGGSRGNIGGGRRQRRGYGEAVGRQRRRARRGQLDAFGGPVRQVEGKADLVPGIRIGGAKADRDRRRRAGGTRSRWRRSASRRPSSASARTASRRHPRRPGPASAQRPSVR